MTTLNGMSNNEIGFEEMFGFRAPTEDESAGAADDLSFKINNDGLPLGTQAFFSAPGLKDISMEYVQSMAEKFAVESGISRNAALTIVYAGFIGATELVATIKLKVES